MMSKPVINNKIEHLFYRTIKKNLHIGSSKQFFHVNCFCFL